jgi:predicted DCC family thiol-disulfide oxidoreductase YuxK
MTTTALLGPVLVYDGDCAFCSSSVRWLERRFPGAFVARPYQRADLAALGLTERQCHERLQWIGDAGAPASTRESGARAVGALVRAGAATAERPVGAAESVLWRTTAAATRVRPTSWIAAALYRAVAANRHRLPGGTPTCRM